MARRGPKPQPAAVKLAKGNPGRRPTGADPVENGEGPAKVTPPSWLKTDGLAVWKRLAPRLAALKLLTETDGETFGRYCRNFARWLKMQQRLDKEGEIYEIETASGKVRRADPAYVIGDRLERQLVAAEAVFGLNPAERQRIFAARADGAAAGLGDLFGQASAPQPAAPVRGKTKPSAPPPAEPARKGPVGFLQ